MAKCEEKQVKEDGEDDEDQFHLLSQNSRHFSLYPSLRKLRRKFAISMSHNGYGGVRNADYDHRRDCIDTNPVTALDHLLLFKQEFVTNPTQTFQDEIKNAQKGLQGDFFLEMGLTKNLSILPDKKNVQDVADGFDKLTRALGMSRRKLSDTDEVSSITTDSHHTAVDADEETTPLTDFANGKKKLKKKKKRKIPISAYVQLLFAVAALSSIGPFLDRLDGVSPPLRIVWRQQGTTLVLWPFALRSILVDGPPRLSLAQWCTFLCASFSYSVLTVAFSASVDYTTVNDATILTNSQSLLLVIAKLVIGSNVVFLEWSGVLVAFAGALMCSRDSAHAIISSNQDNPAWYSIFGDSLAIVSAIGGLGYIMLGKSLREHVEVYVFMTLNMFFGSHMILFYMRCTHDTFTFDRHIDHGVFGWTHFDFDRLPVELCVVFICNLCGTMGYVRAFKYFSSVIIAVAALLEPVTATLLAIVLQVGVFPGWLGCIGNVMVIVGTLMVIYPSAAEEEDDVGDADDEEGLVAVDECKDVKKDDEKI